MYEKYKKTIPLILGFLLCTGLVSAGERPKGVHMSLNGRMTIVRSPNAAAQSRPIIVGIPGGPGLSSKTLKGIESLLPNYDLALIDPPGTGGTAELEEASLENIAAAIEFQLGQLGRPMVLLGHSFGGFYIAQIALGRRIPDIRGLVFVSSPLLPHAVVDLEKQYGRGKSSNLISTEKALDDKPTDEALVNWFASYGRLFFTSRYEHEGSLLIGSDKVSHKSFFNVRLNWSVSNDFEEKFRGMETPTLFLVGSEDVLVRPDEIAFQARALKANYISMPQLGHFCFFESAEETSQTIDSWIQSQIQ